MKKNIIFLIILSILYLPLFLITLFILGLSGIDTSCRFTDIHCILSHSENLIDYLILYGLNLLLIIPISMNIRSIIKYNKEKST